MKKLKILYGIQGTGNGHLSRAQELLPYLKVKADVDILISGMHHDLNLDFEVKYKMQGLGFFFGTSGGVDILKTLRYMNFPRFYNDIKNLDLESYDLVISDFEPITSWACRLNKIPCLGMSHQSSILVENVPLAKKKSFLGMFILKHYAPCKDYVSFHFKKYGPNMFTPVIRKEIRNMAFADKGHYTVYLPAFSDDEIIKVLSSFKGVRWHVFSKHNKKAFSRGSINVFPVESNSFMESIANCSGVLCGAGFETPAEALFLNKKLIVVPMKGQYEQQCNAQALREMGLAVIDDFTKDARDVIKSNFFSEKNTLHVNYPDNAESVVDYVISNFYN